MALAGPVSCKSIPAAHEASLAGDSSDLSTPLPLDRETAQGALESARLTQIVYQYGDPVHAYYADEAAFRADIPRMDRDARTIGYSLAAYDLQGEESLDGTGQVFVAIFKHADRSVIVYRGTNFQSIPNILTDNDWTLVPPPWHSAGKIHHGFLHILEELWPVVQDFYANPEHQQQPIWIAGHSLGGAVATVAAAKFAHTFPQLPLQKIFAFAAPRVGDLSFQQGFVDDGLEQRYLKFVHFNDAVTVLPPTLLGYCDTRSIVYLNSQDQIERLDQHYDQEVQADFDLQVLGALLASGMAGPSSSSMAHMADLLKDGQRPPAQLMAKVWDTLLRGVASFHDVQTYLDYLNNVKSKQPTTF